MDTISKRIIKNLSWISSIRSKFIITYVLVLFTVILLLNTLPVSYSQNLAFETKSESMFNRANIISSSLSGMENLTGEGVAKVLELVGIYGSVRIFVTDDSAKALYDSYGDTVGRYILYPEICSALKGNDTFNSVYHDKAFESSAAVPIVFRNNILGAVYIYDYDTEQGAMIQNIQTTMASVSGIACVIVVFIGFFFTGAIGNRISSILNSIRIVREGEYSHRVDIGGHDELSEMAEEFNSLTNRLQTNEQIRRQFVSDASHELKTPLASIKLLSDSILNTDNMDNDTMHEFVSDIGDQADRLAHLTQKLLTLTKMDEVDPYDNPIIDLQFVTSEVMRSLRTLAKNENVTVVDNTSENCFIRANEDELYQVIFNLTENAIKYNKPGGSVTVSLRRESDKVLLSVADTGIGIPQEHLPNIFNRFYRVDKDRSREKGGSGIGLSIVDGGVRHNGGKVSVESISGKGTTFTVVFPFAKGAEA